MDLFYSSKARYTALFASVALLLSLALGILSITCAAIGGRSGDGMLPGNDGSAEVSTPAGSGPAGADSSAAPATSAAGTSQAPVSTGAPATSNAPAGTAAGDGTAASTGDSIIGAVIAVIVVIAIILVIIALMPRRAGKGGAD